MLALGGWTGSLAGGGDDADPGVYFVPEPHTDSIAVVLGERFGLLGWGALLALFVLLIWRGLAVAQATREPFGRLVADRHRGAAGHASGDQHRHAGRAAADHGSGACRW